MIREHCPSYPGLNISGMLRYSERALVLPGTAVVLSADGVMDYWFWLRSLGIGPREIIAVSPGPDQDAPLLDQLLADPRSRNDLHRCLEIDPDGTVQFFNTTEHEERAMSALGLPWSRVWGPEAGLSRRVNDKCDLRLLAADLLSRHVFPRFRIAEEAHVPASLAELREEGIERALVKRGDLASGDGVISVSTAATDREALSAFFAKHGKCGRKFLVEEHIGDHRALSVQWEVRAPHDYTLTAVSRQVVTRKGEYVGNVMGSGSIPDLSPEDAEQMRRDSEPFIRYFARSGWRGVCGFDFMRDRTGKIFMTECNGRVTALTYAIGIGEQVAERLGGAWGIAVGNVYPDPQTIRSPRAIYAAMSDSLFNGMVGAIPMNVRCLYLPKPKCIVACVAQTAEAAEAQLAEVRARVSCSLTDLV